MKCSLILSVLSLVSFGAFAMEKTFDPAEKAQMEKTQTVTDFDRVRFLEAVSCGSITGVTNYLSRGKDILVRPDSYDISALHIACGNGNIEMVRLLLAAKADVNEQIPSTESSTYRYKGYTPLHMASEKGHDEIVTELIKAGADSTQLTQNNDSSFHLAVRNGHDKVVELLLASKIHPRADSALTLTAAIGGKKRLVIVNLVLNHMRAHSLPFTIKTHAHYAAKIRDLASLIALLAYDGSMVHTRNDDNATPLHVAAGKEDNEAFVQELLARGADVFAVDKEDKTPFERACLAGEADNAQAIIKSVDPDKRKKLIEAKSRPHPLMHEAVSHGFIKVVRMLIRYGADVDSPDEYGVTSLMYAAHRDDEEAKMTQLLLERGAKINAISREHNGLFDRVTPLIAAAREGNSAALRLLVNTKDIDFYKKGIRGYTVFEIAAAEKKITSIAIVLAKLIHDPEHYRFRLLPHIDRCIDILGGSAGNRIDGALARPWYGLHGSVLLKILLSAKAQIERKLREEEISDLLSSLKIDDELKMLNVSKEDLLEVSSKDCEDK